MQTTRNIRFQDSECKMTLLFHFEQALEAILIGICCALSLRVFFQEYSSGAANFRNPRAQTHSDKRVSFFYKLEVTTHHAILLAQNVHKIGSWQVCIVF